MTTPNNNMPPPNGAPPPASAPPPNNVPTPANMAIPSSLVGSNYPDPQAASIHLSLGALLVITVFGSVIVFGMLASFCIWLSRRRTLRRRWHKDVVSGRDSDSVTLGANLTRRRLCKRPSPKASSSSSPRDMSPVRPTALPVIPPLPFRNRSSILGGKWLFEPPKSPTKNGAAWVDEDVLHEPREEEGWMFRSWSLKSLVPALPWRSGSQRETQDDHHHHHHHHYHHHHQQQQQRQPDSPQQQQQQQQQLASRMGEISSPAWRIPPRSLPQPPRPVVTRGHGPGGVPFSPSFWQGFPATEEMRQQKMGPGLCISPTGAILITPRPHHQHPNNYPLPHSTDSTLSEILKSTERRLQEGSVSSGGPRRNASATSLSRASLSKTSISKTPKTSRDTLVAKSEMATDSSTLCPSRPSSRTPSPTKASFGQLQQQHPASGHHDQGLGDDPAPPPPPEADSPPSDEPISPPDVAAEPAEPVRSGGLPETDHLRSKAGSPRSSVSSALSTLYSEDEGPEATAHPTASLNRVFLAPVSYQPPSSGHTKLPSPGKQAPGKPVPARLGHAQQNTNQGRSPDKPSAAATKGGAKSVGSKPQPNIGPGQSLRIVDSPSALNLYATMRASGAYQQQQMRQPAGQPGRCPSQTQPPLIVSRSSSTSRPGVPPGTALTTPGTATSSCAPKGYGHHPPPGQQPSSALVAPSPSGGSVPSPAVSGLSLFQTQWQNDRGPSSSWALPPVRELRPQASSPTLGRHSQENGISAFGIPPSSSLLPAPLAMNRDARARHGHSLSADSSRTAIQNYKQEQIRQPDKHPQPQQQQQQERGRQQAVDPRLQLLSAQALVASASTSSSVYSQDSRPRRSLSLDSGRRAGALKASETASSLGGGGSGGHRYESRTPSLGLASAVAQLRRTNSAASVGSSSATGLRGGEGGEQEQQEQEQKEQQQKKRLKQQKQQQQTQQQQRPAQQEQRNQQSQGSSRRNGVPNSHSYLGRLEAAAAAARAEQLRGTRALIHDAGQWSTVSVHKIGVEQGPAVTLPAMGAAGLGARVEGKKQKGSRAASQAAQTERRTSSGTSGTGGGSARGAQARRQGPGPGLREGSDANRGTPPAPAKSVTNAFLEKQGLGARDRPLSQESLELYDKDGFLISTTGGETGRGGGWRG